MKLEKSKTQENLKTAFLREAGAAAEYGFYAERAKSEGYQRIYETFTKFAENELAHAKLWFKLFHGISDTEENLKDSADLEHHERTVMYKEFSKVAKDEGFTDIANKLDMVAEIENTHEQVYNMIYGNVKKDAFFVSDKGTWQCLNCGHIYKGKNPPENCPVCSFPKGFFAVKPQTEG